MMLNCRAKNEAKRSSHSRDVFCKRITQSNEQREFWDKTQKPNC